MTGDLAIMGRPVDLYELVDKGEDGADAIVARNAGSFKELDAPKYAPHEFAAAKGREAIPL